MTTWFILFTLIFISGQFAGFYIGGGLTLYILDLLLIPLGVYLISSGIIRHKMQSTGLVKPLAIFISAAVISLVVNFGKYALWENAAGILYLLRWLLYVSCFALTAFELVPFSKIRLWFYFTPLIMAFLGIIQYFLYPDLRNIQYLGWDPHYMRLVSTLLDPNFVGLLLVFGFLYGLHLASQKPAWTLMVGQAIILLSIVLTYSRSSYLALLGGLVVFAASSRMFRYLVIVFAGAILIYILVPKSNLDVNRIFRTETSAARIATMNQALNYFRQAPVFGLGFNTIRFVDNHVSGGSAPDRAGAGIDTSWLFVLAASGLVGFAAYLYLYLRAVARLRLRGSYFWPIFTAFLIHSLFTNSQFYPWVLVYIWMLIGLANREDRSVILRSKPPGR